MWQATETILIFDLADMGMRHLSAQVIFTFVAALFKEDQTHFPNTIGKIVIVNTPLAFSALWAIVSRWLHRALRVQAVPIGPDALANHPRKREPAARAPPSR